MLSPTKYECVYRVANADIASEEFDGEFVVLDLQKGHYYSMDGAAAIVWQALNDGVTPSQLAGACSNGKDCGPQDVLAFCNELEQLGLLLPTAEASDKELSASTAAALAGQENRPETTVYDDLAELMLADPIHEVEEDAGWPVRKPAENGADG